ncbi:MAG: TIGR03667 family PPOX class F420-dependent oxidoreductase [Anaerolineae bacterium]|nr:TIGR03667 family PPOX class F420-dependent oxidoreductase [Anaerolineae bacterium]
MAAEITPEIQSQLEKAYVIWFTTVRADGTPQPTPVWFVWEDGEFLIYTTPKAQKHRNIQANPKVALNLDGTDDGKHYVVFFGEAVVDPKTPAPTQMPAYIEKYRQGILDINMTPESFDESYTIAIRIKPTHVRSE